jgi:hypothetical protein
MCITALCNPSGHVTSRAHWCPCPCQSRGLAVPITCWWTQFMSVRWWSQQVCWVKFAKISQKNFTYLCMPAQVITYHHWHHPKYFSYSYLGNIQVIMTCFPVVRLKLLRSQQSFPQQTVIKHWCVFSFINKGAIFLTHHIPVSVGLIHTAKWTVDEAHILDQHLWVLISTGHLSCLGMSVPESATSTWALGLINWLNKSNKVRCTHLKGVK